MARLKRSARVTKTTGQKALRRTRTSATSLARQSDTAATQATRTAMRRSAQVAATVQGVADDADDVLDVLDRDLADKLLDAVRFAVDMWKLQAKFRNIKIYAVAATGAPGCLDGPDLESLINHAPTVAGMQGHEAELRDAVAEGVADCFDDWQDKVIVPGLPWYPAFAAWPGPSAPPMPNVPVPLISCTSSSLNKIATPGPLTDAMVDALPDSLQVDTITTPLGAIAASLAMAFSIWVASQQVMNVLGKGKVPAFAPPYVPVGPVVNGSVISQPGHLAAGPGLQPITPPQL